MRQRRNEPNAPTSQLIFPNAEQVTAAQISNLLAIGSLAMSGLMGGQYVNMSSIPGAGEKQGLPEGAEASAEYLFKSVCKQLQNIVEDKSRWSLAKQKELEAAFMKSHALNQEYLEYQTEAAFNCTTPHFRFHPSLAKLKSGLFAAFIGNPEDASASVVGIGRSPEEAMRNFDEMFYQGVPAALDQYLRRREKAAEAGEPLEPFKHEDATQENTEQQEPPVDDSGSRPAEAPKRWWHFRRRNSKNTPPDDASGGNQVF